MWTVHLFDAADASVSPVNAAMRYFTVWGTYAMQEEAIEVRNDLMRDGAYAKITYQN